MARESTAALLGLLAVCHFPADEGIAAELPAIVVTPTRTPGSVGQALAPVSVISREDIERAQAPSMLELLRLQAGLDLARTGGPGSQTSVFLRGSNSNHVLVLIDGVRVASASNGLFAFEQLSPAQIERIEVVRGPRASLYGSDAIGGVIHIFSRDNAGASARLGGGSYGSAFLDAGWGGAIGRSGRVSIQASHEDTHGFSATNPEAGPFVYDPDKDGHRSTSLTASGGIELGDQADLELRAWHSDGNNEFDQGETDTLNQTLSARLGAHLLEGWEQSLRLAQSRDEAETASDFASRFETRRLGADWQHDLALPAAGTLTLGLDYWRDDVLNDDLAAGVTVYDERLSNRGIFVGLQQPLDPFILQAALRRDRHSEFGGKTTGQLALGYDLSQRLQLVASYGTAFRAPNANELFSPGFTFEPAQPAQFAGNPELDPETSASIEAGLRYRPSVSHSLSLDFYHTEVDDLIAFQGANFQAVNINEARLRGVELSYAGNRGPWWLQAALTLQEAKDLASDQDLLRRPDQKLALQLDYRFSGGASLGGEILGVSEREDLGGPLPGYGLLNLRGSLPMAHDLTLEARVENLFDKLYHLARGFNTPGLSAYLAVRWSPQP